jgi:hypothetical protein
MRALLRPMLPSPSRHWDAVIPLPGKPNRVDRQAGKTGQEEAERRKGQVKRIGFGLLECGGKRSATPLSHRERFPVLNESAVIA